jgi:hypothetical protein
MAGNYQLVDYFDVWGNEEDGYEVNNLSRLDIYIYITDEATKEDIIKELIVCDYLKPNASLENIEVEWNDEFFIELFQKDNMYPICRLELVDNLK